MFAECIERCWECSAADGGCLAGHGDYDYWPATEDQLRVRLQQERWEKYHDAIKAKLGITKD